MGPKTIPFLDLAAQNGPLFDRIRTAFERVAADNRFILGPEVEAFEREVAGIVGVRNAIGVSSGTDALLISLMALGVGAGHEVITTPFSFFATAGCIARLGARPVFVDIEPGTGNLDASLVTPAVTARTKAVLAVHLYGQPCDLRSLQRVCQQHGLWLVEDAAQAIGARRDGLSAGAAGILGCFSFFPSKNLGAFGDAGLVATDSEELAERIRSLRVHGASPKYFHALIGGNFRLDALQAAILRAKLPYLASWTGARRRNALLYDRLFQEAGLPAEVLRTPLRVTEEHVYNQYVIRTNKRDALRDHLGAQRIGCEVYYPRPLHLQKCFDYLGNAAGSFPNAELAADQVLALPVFPELGDERVRHIAAVVVDFLRNLRD